MKMFFCALLTTAACGPTAPGNVADAAPQADVTTYPDALIYDAPLLFSDAGLDAAVPEQPDAFLFPAPDAEPMFLPWTDWTGSYTVTTALLGSSTCTESASFSQNHLDINVPPWAMGITEWSIDSNMATAFYTNYSLHADGSLTFTSLPGGTYRVVNDGTALAHQISDTQFHVDAWVDHDTSPGNPDAPCHWDWNITGTRI